MTHSHERCVVFETARGPAGLAWGPAGITWVQLPEATKSDATRRIREARPAAEPVEPEGAMADVVRRLRAHLAGGGQDFSDLELDMSALPPFRRKVYEALRTVSAGLALSYGELAQLVGSPGAARAVGQAMASNPYPVIVPCHRVLASGRRVGGFSAYGGAQTKVDLLALEGVTLSAKALGLGFEPEAAQGALRASDHRMRALVDRVGPLRLLVDPLESPFEALIKAIVYQQLTGKAAKTIAGRLCGLYGDGTAYPTPSELIATPDDALRGVGLSRAKAAGLKDLAAKSISGVVPTLRALRAMEDEEIIERLITIRGIGRWSVEMLLIFRLGRPDVFPIDDYGMRKGLALLLGQSEALKPKRTSVEGEGWAPFRSAASWYLWRATELEPDFFSTLHRASSPT